MRVFDGAQTGLEKNLIRACWDADGGRVAAGGGDGSVTVWDAKTGKMGQKLPGHRGTVNDVRVSFDGSMGEFLLSPHILAGFSRVRVRVWRTAISPYLVRWKRRFICC